MHLYTGMAEGMMAFSENSSLKRDGGVHKGLWAKASESRKLWLISC